MQETEKKKTMRKDKRKGKLNNRCVTNVKPKNSFNTDCL
jgi:hypothetical protein